MTQVLKAAEQLNLASCVYEDRSSQETVKDKVICHLAGRKEFAIAAFKGAVETIYNLFKAAIDAVKGIFNKDLRANLATNLNDAKQGAKIAVTGFIGAVVCPAAGIAALKRLGLEKAPAAVPSVAIAGLVTVKA